MRLIITYLIVLACGFIHAQEKAVVFTGNHPDGGIQVKWIYYELYHPDGFNIYRKEGAGEYQKLNSSPIKFNDNLGFSFDKEEQDLVSAMKKLSHAEMKGSMIRAFILIKSIYNNELAETMGIYFHDQTAQKGKKYQYKIYGGNSVLAESELIKCNNYEPIAPPKTPLSYRTKKNISLNWMPELYRYYGVEVYRSNSGSDQFDNKTKEGPIALQPTDAEKYAESVKYFLDTAISNDDSYVYQLKAIDYFGQSSDFGEPIVVPAQDFDPPEAPYELKVRPSSVNQSATLQWKSIDEVDLAGYNIYYSRTLQGEFVKLNKESLPKEETQFEHKGIEVGGHFYAVSSVDLAGNESASNIVTTETKDRVPPEAPKGFKAKAESGQITLSWNSNSESDLKGYIIEKTLNDSNLLDNSYVVVNANPITETTFTEKLSKNIRNEFVYRVIAIDTSYNRSLPSVNSLAQMPDVIPPKKPVLKNLEKTEKGNKVEWLKNVDMDLAGYNLFKEVKGDSSTRVKVNINMIPKNISSYVDRTFEEGVSYTYFIKAIDLTGNQSEISEGFTIQSAKKNYSELTLDVLKSSYNEKKKLIQIVWSAPKGVDMRGYVVYQKDKYGVLKPVSGLSNYLEYSIKKEITQDAEEFEIRGYTIQGDIIKSKKISVVKV